MDRGGNDELGPSCHTLSDCMIICGTSECWRVNGGLCLWEYRERVPHGERRGGCVTQAHIDMGGAAGIHYALEEGIGVSVGNALCWGVWIRYVIDSSDERAFPIAGTS